MFTNVIFLLILFSAQAEKIPYSSNMMAEVVHDSLVITISDTVVPDSNTMVRKLFAVFDNLPNDDYLDYREIAIFQYLTNPEAALTPDIWIWVRGVIGSNHKRGINIMEFNSSYYNPARDILGTDIVRDWTRVIDASKRSQSF